MEQTSIRERRTTLLDQISMMEPTNLGDLINLREGDNIGVACRRGGRAVTLASILESEERVERRLVDILREEGQSSLDPPEMTEERGAGVPLMALLGLTGEFGGDDTTTAAAERGVSVPLMTLLDLTNELGGDDTTTSVDCSGDGESDAVADEMVCCVCLVRKKGAAFIPCGHTFCRVCSRELWAVRRFCPLCNAVVADVLDIF